MKRLRLAVILIALGVVLWGFWAFRNDLPQLGKTIEEKAAATVAQLQQSVSAPPPLVGPKGAPAGTLTAAGVREWTNFHRKAAGVAPLTENAKLDAGAEAKMKDLFAQQYFEHVSPDGRGPADVAKADGYAYVEIGENLALGDFGSDKALVQAWMDSPGHRANILHATFKEIGVAVGKGTYQGHVTWIAVQEFGRPIADCPYPSSDLKARIDSEDTQVQNLKTQADQAHAELDAMGTPRTKEERDAYNQKVAEYNTLVNEINAYVEEIKQLTTEYNAQVNAFNACAKA